jgi:acyl carrier protein
MAVQKKFGVRAQTDDAENQKIYASVKNLAAFIVEQRANPASEPASEEGAQ